MKSETKQEESMQVEDSKEHVVRMWGAWSQKRIGEFISDALMRSPIVTIDARELKTIKGQKPPWRK